ncbi:Crp/Fnr family transcriptional regulator [Zeaxanthinibacter enoshimensis]|uniref:Crp/Fnr family transcriptional regulator n=1 Tax=Zeaxanthinibacter enoshimensis TaxID=392009 RepID=UPI003565AFC5
MVNEILAHVENYISLNQEEEEFFTSLLTKLEINKKTWLVRPGARIEHEYFVVSGCLKAYYLDESGDKHIIQFAIENWWVGDFDAFYNKVDSRLYIEALEDSTLLAISYDDLQQLFERVPKFERYFRLLITNAFISLRGRVLSSLEKTLKERYLEFCRVYPNIEKRVANYHIANYLGASPESLSRIRRKLVKTA